ncbi:hypothetical protein IWQ61_000763 [Dispira simplex]|nr:hypothetical protein IWQ61_000763 [Dispira simplex]
MDQRHSSRATSPSPFISPPPAVQLQSSSASPVMGTASWVPKVGEAAAYNRFFKRVDHENQGFITGQQAVSFFTLSKLPANVLGEVWELADSDHNGRLSPGAFNVAMKLIALAQQGEKPSLAVLHKPSPLPTFEGVSVEGLGSPKVQQPTQPETPGGIGNSTVGELPTTPLSGVARLPAAVRPITPSLGQDILSVSERNKYARLFQNSHPKDGLLDGERARHMLMKSKLPVETLGQIWNLADTQHRGALDLADFMIAMYYIQRLMEGRITTLPTEIPASLLASARGTTGTSSSTAPPSRSGVLSPDLSKFDPSRPSSSVSSQLPTTWGVPPEVKHQADRHFATLDTARRGWVTGDEAVPFFLKSGLSDAELARIWDLADRTKMGKLNSEEFTVALYLIQQRRGGVDIPVELPDALVPPSRRTLVSTAARSPQLTRSTTLQSGPARSLSPIHALDPFQPFSTGSVPGSPCQPRSPQLPRATSPIGQTERSASQLLFDPLMDITSSSNTGSVAPKSATPLVSNTNMSTATQLATLQGTLAQKHSKASELLNQRATLENTHAHLSGQFSELTLQLNQVHSRIEEEERLIRELEAAITHQREQLPQLQQEVVDAEAKRDQLASTRTEKQKELDQAQEQNGNFQQRLQLMLAEIQKLQTETQRLTQQAQSDKQRAEIGQRQLAQMEQERASLQHQWEMANQEAQAQQGHFQKIAQHNENLQHTNDQLRANLEKTKAQVVASTAVSMAVPRETTDHSSANGIPNGAFDAAFAVSDSSVDGESVLFQSPQLGTKEKAQVEEAPFTASAADPAGSIPVSSSASQYSPKGTTTTLSKPTPPPEPILPPTNQGEVPETVTLSESPTSGDGAIPVSSNAQLPALPTQDTLEGHTSVLSPNPFTQTTSNTALGTISRTDLTDLSWPPAQSGVASQEVFPDTPSDTHDIGSPFATVPSTGLDTFSTVFDDHFDPTTVTLDEKANVIQNQNTTTAGSAGELSTEVKTEPQTDGVKGVEQTPTDTMRRSPDESVSTSHDEFEALFANMPLSQPTLVAPTAIGEAEPATPSDKEATTPSGAGNQKELNISRDPLNSDSDDFQVSLDPTFEDAPEVSHIGSATSPVEVKEESAENTVDQAKDSGDKQINPDVPSSSPGDPSINVSKDAVTDAFVADFDTAFGFGQENTATANNTRPSPPPTSHPGIFKQDSSASTVPPKSGTEKSVTPSSDVAQEIREFESRFPDVSDLDPFSQLARSSTLKLALGERKPGGTASGSASGAPASPKPGEEPLKQLQLDHRSSDAKLAGLFTLNPLDKPTSKDNSPATAASPPSQQLATSTTEEEPTGDRPIPRSRKKPGKEARSSAARPVSEYPASLKKSRFAPSRFNLFSKNRLSFAPLSKSSKQGSEAKQLQQQGDRLTADRAQNKGGDHSSPLSHVRQPSNTVASRPKSTAASLSSFTFTPQEFEHDHLSPYPKVISAAPSNPDTSAQNPTSAPTSITHQQTGSRNRSSPDAPDSPEVLTLVGMGFPRDRVIEALEVNDFDMQRATDYLLSY